VARIDELRAMTKIARMYHEQGMRQSAIAKRLNLSQATISRFLKRAQEEGIVRISVNMPQGIYAVLEEELIATYGLHDAIVVDSTSQGDEYVQRDIGSAAGYYVESTIGPNQVVGLSSWSETLLAMVDAMHQLSRPTDAQVIQILGGIGNPAVEVYATRLLERFAQLVRGTAIHLPAPGILGSSDSLQVFLDDPYVGEVMALFDKVDLALVGIGDVEPSKLLAQSGNKFSSDELEMLRAKGAVGDILLHFFDADGNPVDTALNDRVASMRLEQLRAAERSVGIAGGKRKYAAILGALHGGWLNVLITDRFTAERLVAEGMQGRLPC
jgi:DNA-binding transcriptional regulator LsrR (DeoR family)